MADNHTPEVRSYNMAQIKSRNTGPEELVRKYLFSKGLRFRKNDKRYLGHPDIVLPKYKTIVFVNGCFWHMHEGCPNFVWPKSNSEYWRRKLMKNKERDKLHINSLEHDGWQVITIWECELKGDNQQAKLNALYQQIVNSKIVK